MRNVLLFLICILPLSAAKKIHTYVCLCDNLHQGIVPVGAKIGNGLDPANNLYWGCSDGLAKYFQRSKKWKLIETAKPKDSPILVTLTFQHQATKSKLVAHAYRGDRMEKCLEDFLTQCREGGKDDLTAFLGHNGLMDTLPKIPSPAKADDEASTAIVLGCLTDSYFSKHLKSLNTNPILMTRSLMYPGSFLLHDAIEIWLKKGTPSQVREAAAKAYGKNQKISTKAARTIFTDLK